MNSYIIHPGSLKASCIPHCRHFCGAEVDSGPVAGILGPNDPSGRMRVAVQCSCSLHLLLLCMYMARWTDWMHGLECHGIVGLKKI